MRLLLEECCLNPFPKTPSEIRGLNDDTLASLYAMLTYVDGKEETPPTNSLPQPVKIGRDEMRLYRHLLIEVIQEISRRDFKPKEAIGTCYICKKPGKIRYCSFCKKWFCDECYKDYPARIRAAAQEAIERLRRKIIS